MSRLRGVLHVWRAFRRRLTTRIFVCYRRDGAGAGYALDLRNRLAALIGPGNVFLDVADDAIAVGEDWRRKVSDAIDRSRIVVVMIESGSWVERLTNPDDAVRFELGRALAGRERGELQIFPVLVGEARMPAASDLPAPLAAFPGLSASHIRSATADEDVEGIVRRLVGRSSAIPTAAPDRIDALIALATAAAAFALWLSFFRAEFNTNEKWLWGTAVGLAIAAACVLRRTIASWHLGASRAWRPAAILLAIVVAGTVALLAGYRLVYHVPRFSEKGVGGFLIARFGGDSNDRARADFATELARILNAESIPRYLRVPSDNIPDLRLNQRLGLVTDTSNPLILLVPHRLRDDEEAKAYAASSRASIVVWGSIEHPGELDISVSFAPENEPIDEVPAGVVGWSGIQSISRKAVDIVDVQTVQRALVWLLAGYSKYHVREPDYDDALASFRNGLKALEKLTDEQQKGLVGALKATLSLYAGNSLLFRGNISDATAAYRLAEKLSTIGRTHLFVEPVNNLAYLARAQGNSYPVSAPGDGSSARELLQSVLPECAETTLMPRPGCAYVWYNLGATFHDEADAEDDDVKARDLYAQAGELFQNTIEMLRSCQEGSPVDRMRCRLLPEAFQNWAYGLAKQAELSASPGADQIAEISRRSEQAMEAFRRLGIPVPSYYLLTAGRVHLLRGEGKEAAEQLIHLREAAAKDATWPQWARAELNLLLAAAQQCSGKPDEGEISLATYRQLAGSLPNPERAQFREIQEMPRLTKHCHVLNATKE